MISTLKRTLKKAFLIKKSWKAGSDSQAQFESKEIKIYFFDQLNYNLYGSGRQSDYGSEPKTFNEPWSHPHEES